MFSGSYDDYMKEAAIKRTSLEQELSLLGRHRKETHQALMQEQERAKNRKAYGEEIW